MTVVTRKTLNPKSIRQLNLSDLELAGMEEQQRAQLEQLAAKYGENLESMRAMHAVAPNQAVWSEEELKQRAANLDLINEAIKEGEAEMQGRVA